TRILSQDINAVYCRRQGGSAFKKNHRDFGNRGVMVLWRVRRPNHGPFRRSLLRYSLVRGQRVLFVHDEASGESRTSRVGIVRVWASLREFREDAARWSELFIYQRSLVSNRGLTGAAFQNLDVRSRTEPAAPSPLVFRRYCSDLASKPSSTYL